MTGSLKTRIIKQSTTPTNYFVNGRSEVQKIALKLDLKKKSESTTKVRRMVEFVSTKCRTFTHKNRRTVVVDRFFSTKCLILSNVNSTKGFSTKSRAPATQIVNFL